MSLDAKNPNSLTTQHTQPLVLNDDNDMEVFDFSTLRDELAVDHSGEKDEQEHDVQEFFQNTGDTLGFEFATDIDNLTSTTFEEEAFGVKKAGPRTTSGNFKQTQPNLWNKDPFAGPSYETTSPKNDDTGNKSKKIIRHANPPPISREISAGVSFASILSGNVPKDHDKDGALGTNHGLITDINTRTDTHTDSDVPKTPQPPLSTTSSEIKQPPSTRVLQEMKAGGEQHSQVTDPTQPTVYSVADIEANMCQQQRSSNKNLLYQLLPGLSQQQQPPAAFPQDQTSKQPLVDINSFFQKQQHPPSSVAATQQPQVDVNSFFKKHHQKQQQQQQQQAHSVNLASSATHQHTSTTTIHKPNMTTEQEIKQKEDDGKDSYNGLMTARNIKHIDQIERSKLVDSNQHSSGDFYYHMYTANHGGQPHAPALINQAANVNNTMIYQQEQHGASKKDASVILDKVLGKIIHERECHSGDSPHDDKGQPRNDHQQLLKTIESVYFLVLQVEQSYREMNGTTHNPTTPSSTGQETVSKIWNILAMDQSPPTVIPILKVNKGMSLIGRLIPHLDESQRQILMTTIAYYFVDILPSPPVSSVDTHGSQLQQHQQQPNQHQHQRQNVDYLHPSISGCLEHVLFCASLPYISQILSSVSNHSDFKSLLGTTTGHRFLGALLFHAKGKQLQQQELDCEQWKATYGSYFDKAMDHSSLIKNMAHLDNLAVWMLLNSMVGCCTPQQKEVMAQAYRETISMTMKTISDLERNHVPVPYPIQAAYPVVKELWSHLSLADVSLDQNGCP